MKYFLDTEFIEDGKTIDLISIGIVTEDGREFYCESSEFDESKACDWVRENVITKLWPANGRQSRADIRNEILDFIGSDTPEFWGYYASYDWVVFCQLFGTMMDLPKGFPMYINDIMQIIDDNPKRKTILEMAEAQQKLADDRHIAIGDARRTMEIYKKLVAA